MTTKLMRVFLKERLDASLRLLIGFYDFSLCHVHSSGDNFDVFSVCKQQNAPKDTVPVGTSQDPAPQPAMKKPAGKASNGGRGSWIPPNIISPK
jgi:hypothetical protein